VTVFTIVLMGVITFILRFSFFAVPGDWAMPKPIERAQPYVLPAVLMALLVPGVVLSQQGSVRTPVYGPYLLGIAAGFVVATVRKDNFFLVFGVSVAAFVAAKLVFAL
jgi:branched-subunit amino acid transport protein